MSLNRKYIAVVGLDYRDEKSGKPVRVEAGDEVVGLRRAALENELQAGNIQAVSESPAAVEKKTEINNDISEEGEK